jgi:hypothetical protein
MMGQSEIEPNNGRHPLRVTRVYNPHHLRQEAAMRIPTASLLFILIGTSVSAIAQVVPSQATVPPVYTQPPPTVYVPSYPTRTSTPRVDTAALQREAKELLELSQSVQPDIESLKSGLLSKDLTDRLKRIEKISKRLRSEIAPLGN